MWHQTQKEAFPGTCFVITGPQELGFLYKLAELPEQRGLTLGVPATLPAVCLHPPRAGH